MRFSVSLQLEPSKVNRLAGLDKKMTVNALLSRSKALTVRRLPYADNNHLWNSYKSNLSSSLRTSENSPAPGAEKYPFQFRK